MKRFLVLIGLMAGTALASDGVDVRKSLVAACPGVAKYSQELQLTEPVKQVADLTLQREKGWKQVYSIKATVADRPQALLAAGIKAQGQVCTFDLDAKSGNEVAVSKVGCMSICAGDVLQNIGRPYVGYFGTNGQRQFMN